ncbi:hypothetical protein BN7_5076 [Wickerhamomyces ciferrii]|uniref:Protein BCP1 n=1 Tax=Wickerhamomyces ciferrii (strain ATCC 14091 / BCRC 22168 / CBS 111 / JCM 3599 / NBRC 0793 / NRRL Y-1031 F-60-10) TaxID=1206466 RepID=K0KVJ8_WICCF|nr:uncharacterized protein BN7_5076 [Wickerhamomyces ciferrii]CCH45494.1 hypothetical protein BN7_5076 [Wickerhamomyces ciferrii]
MSKRRIQEEEEEESDIDISSTDSENSEGEEEEEEEIVNVDFDFFDINKDIDFHAIKNLTRQLLGEDSKKLQISPLADLILEAPTITIKTDGKDSDPYAFLSALNLKELKSNDYIKYIHKADAQLSSNLNKISHKNNALLLGERMINMPIQVIPAIYKLTLEEAEKANGEAYDNYLLPSRKYEINEETEDNSKKRIKTVEVDFFHFEDQFFEENASFKTQLQSRGGVLQTFMVLTHDNLIKSISQLEDTISEIFG